MTRVGPLDPEVAQRVAQLSLQARRAVDGGLSGIHRSPHRGASVVFVEHREYRPGDDLRLLDWRAYARSDRHQIRRFEQETQLTATLVLDRSGSMAFADGGRPEKTEVAAALLAAVALVLLRQGDAPGLLTFDRTTRDRIPARTQPAQLEHIMTSLVAPPEAGAGTDLAGALRAAADGQRRRGLVLIASDLLDFADDALYPLSHLVSRGHDVRVLQVLDPTELDLSEQAPARFVGLEGEAPVEADPGQLRSAYRAEVAAFLERCRRRTIAAGARYELVRTDEPLSRVLARALASPKPGSRSGLANC